jgi:predicted ferric reductase
MKLYNTWRKTLAVVGLVIILVIMPITIIVAPGLFSAKASRTLAILFALGFASALSYLVRDWVGKHIK